MRRISSGWTFSHKRVFPTIWFGFLLVFIGISVSTARHSPSAMIPFVVGSLAMMAFGYFFMKTLIFDLVDKVWEDGDALIVRNGGQEQRIALADIKNVNYSPFINPPRVTLSLRRPTIFGDQITFGAPARFIPFSTSPIINDLIDRVDASRQQRA
jgi:hypothetical protein